jgi:hypothetical protein
MTTRTWDYHSLRGGEKKQTTIKVEVEEEEEEVEVDNHKRQQRERERERLNIQYSTVQYSRIHRRHNHGWLLQYSMV